MDLCKRTYTALLLLLICQSCHALTYYITPTSDTPCPGEPCHTLSKYAHQYDQTFDSNPTMVFLPGEHSLRQSISFSWMNVTRLEMLGESSSLPDITSKVACTATSAGFTIEGNNELYINALAFVSCGHGGRAAIHLKMVEKSLISNCSFQDGYTSMKRSSSAVYIHDSNVTLTQNTFQNNFASFGGVVRVQNARISLIKNVFHYNFLLKQRLVHVWKSNITLMQNKFQKNFGEILWARHSMLTFTKNMFQYNSASDMILIHNSALNIIGNEFKNNTASGHVFLGQNSSCNLTGNTFHDNFIFESILQFGNKSVLHFAGNTFHNNTGVLSISFSTLTFTRNSLWSNAGQYHGAIFIDQSHVSLTGNVFYSNVAKYDGGVLYAQNTNLTLKGNTLQNNSAGFCGGILYAENTNVTLEGNVILNNSAIDGGALFVRNTQDLTLKENTFQNNLAFNFGGVLYAQDTTFTLKGNILQNNTAVLQGGVLYVQNTNFSFQGNTFQNNFASDCGGVLYVLDTNLSLKGNIFQNNSIIDDGAVLFALNANLTLEGNIFKSNYAEFDGGVLSVTDSRLRLIRNTFRNNVGKRDGGVLHVLNTVIILIGNTFQNNSATYFGGIMYARNSYANFTSNNLTESLAQFGAAIFATKNSIRMHKYNKIESNVAEYGGGILVIESHLEFAGNTVFENNTASYGGGLYAYNTNISGYIIFANNLAAEGGGGICASESTFKFANGTTFIHNSAVDGGGILLLSNAKLSLLPDTHIYFSSNSAKNNGGAIKVEVSNPLNYCLEFVRNAFFEFSPLLSTCFFQIEPIEPRDIISLISNIRLRFENNTATKDGTILYGGSVDNCDFDSPRRIVPLLVLTSGEVFDTIVNYVSQSPDVSSEPLYTCTCENHVTDCSGIFTSKPIFPGGKLEVPVIVYGQRNGTTTAVVQVMNTFNSSVTVHELENTQNTNNNCTVLRYTVQSLAERTLQEMTLYAEGLCPLSERNKLKVFVEILPCPPGFQLSEIQKTCICAERLQQFTNTCVIDTGMFLRKENAEFWVGYGDENGSLILHPHCPFDYCIDEETYVAFDDSDNQCNYNRSGLLCGRCDQDLSLVLGSSRCLKCPNSFIALFTVFILAGIILVLLLFILRLTVAAGTINGLTFYANVLAVNSAIFFQPQTTNILTIFISWLNLDLGIETCFYNGLDAYAKMWLQFSFPLYVWALAGMIVCVSYYSSKMASLFGSNPIAVLATLFLLSYAKLLRTIIAALSFTFLEYPDHLQTAVWLYDGNIPYLGRKHIPLFIAAVVCILFLFLPYTILLMFGQWFQAKSGWKPFSWTINPKLKPFLDAYHAPFTDKHRYWPGLMLLLRFLLFLISAFNVLGNPIINLLAISFAGVAILTRIALFGTKIYKTWSLNFLEISFIVNLTILALASYHVRLTGSNQSTVTFTSIGVAFATFAGIIVYHTVKQIKDTSLWRRIIKPALSIKTQVSTPEQKLDQEGGVDSGNVPLSALTTTVVDLHDLQLHDHEYRESCLETN